MSEGTTAQSQGNKKENYIQIQEEVEKPISERTLMVNGRGGRVVRPRRHHISQEEVERKKREAEVTGSIPNPFSRIGAYWGQVQSLIALGANEWHSFHAVTEKLQEILSQHETKDRSGSTITYWDKFASRSSSGQSVTGRVLQNFRVLQRIPSPDKKDKHPYGVKLMQLCMAIDIKYELPEGVTDGDMAVPYVRLNTQFDSPEEAIPTYDNPYAKRGRRKKNKNKETEKKQQTEKKQDQTEEAEQATATVEEGASTTVEEESSGDAQPTPEKSEGEAQADAIIAELTQQQKEDDDTYIDYETGQAVNRDGEPVEQDDYEEYESEEDDSDVSW